MSFVYKAVRIRPILWLGIAIMLVAVPTACNNSSLSNAPQNNNSGSIIGREALLSSQ
jgi:hypothetical protein